MRGDRQKDLQRHVIWLHKPPFLGEQSIRKTLEATEPEAWAGNEAQEGERAEKCLATPHEASILQ